MKDIVVCTAVEESKYEIYNVKFLINSFKKFHPNIDFVCFAGEDVKKLFKEKSWLNWSNAKASFSKLLYNDYKLVVNIDADTIILGSLDEIFEADYEVGACAAYNIQSNFGLNIKIPSTCVEKPFLVSEKEMVHCGILASTSKIFWDHYEEICRTKSKQFVFSDCDLLCILYYYGNYKTKVFEGHTDFDNINHKFWYNVSSFGKEYKAIVNNDKIMLENKQIKAYHWACGNDYPKMRYRERFTEDVSKKIDQIISD